MVSVVVECRQGELPEVAEAPQRVTVRLGRLGPGDADDFRALLRELAASGPRTIDVDLFDLDVAHRPVVFAVLVGARREGRRLGTTVRVRRAPAELRRTFAVVGIEEADGNPPTSYVFTLGGPQARRSRRLLPSAAT